MYIQRHITDKLLRMIELFPVVVITGARQVGKSTLLKEILGHKADMVIFDPVIDIENARQDPELFLNNHRTPLILDEIQYAPELVPAVKRRVDKSKKPGQYILTGSQQWGILKSIAESLTGRAVFLDIEGFSLAEIAQVKTSKPWLSYYLENCDDFLKKPWKCAAQKFSLYEQIWRGFLPDAQFLPLDVIGDFHNAYQRTYIERDARVLGEISDLQLFGRFFRMMAALTGQEVNYSQLGREIGISPKTAQRWISILTATFQWIEIPGYSGNALKRISSRPKGYIADTGVTCSSQAISSPNAIANHPLWGRIFETAVVSEIRKQCALLSMPPRMYHWRSHSGAEVDILLERDGIFFPLEIKAKSNPVKADTQGITAFRKTYPRLNIAKGLIIAPAEKVIQLSGNDYSLPWNIAPGEFISGIL
ncbi:MAG: ATP-binding protein [Candidatus Omnitrophica bacterium]|nr:ATP-binding protein [Candidatus Omnitrophota bacterium]